MGIQTEAEKTRYEFCLRDLGPDPELEKDAKLKLVQLLALAPPGATAFGFVEKSDRAYLAAVQVRSPYRTFLERASGVAPRTAVHRVLQKLEDRLYEWRFGGGPSGASANPFSGNTFQQTQRIQGDGTSDYGMPSPTLSR